MRMAKILLVSFVVMLLWTTTSFAHQNFKARPYSVSPDLYTCSYNEARISSFKEFFGSFDIVERDGLIGFYRQGDYKFIDEWAVEVILVPERLIETYEEHGNFHYLNSTLTWLNVSFYYFGSENKYPDNSLFRTVVPTYFRVQLTNGSSLNEAQRSAIVQSIKTKQPIRLKGKLSFRTVSLNLQDLIEGLRYVDFEIQDNIGEVVNNHYCG